MKKKVSIYAVIIAFIFIGCFYSIKKMTRNQSIYDYNNFVEVIEDKDRNAAISGQNRAGNPFQIRLDYAKTGVILRDAYLMDLTEDNIQELCLEMNFWSSASSDFKTFVICDMENQKILFPTPDKEFIYDGYIDNVKTDHGAQSVIRYTSYIKRIDEKGNSVLIADEDSVIAWNVDSFDTLEYQNKLLMENQEYLFFYKKISTNEIPLFKLVILEPYTLQTFQEIELKLDETSITEKIKNKELVSKIGNGNFDLYVEGYGPLYWDSTLKKFK